MAHTYLNDLEDRLSIDSIYLVNEKTLRPNRNGNLYLQLQLADKSGSVQGLQWNASEKIFQGFEVGDYIRIEGTSQVYQGGMQIMVKKLQRVDASTIDPEDYTAPVPDNIEELIGKLQGFMRSIRNPHLQALGESFLVDEDFMNKFSRAPAGIKNHHAYIGGLLDHVVNMMTVYDRIYDLYPQIDRDLLMMGIFLHDMGKVSELSFDRVFSYTDEGQLLGHLVQAVEILTSKITEAEKLLGETFPKEIGLRLKHMIISHHGEYEYGSPKLPMTIEALALWIIDNLDAKIASFSTLMEADTYQESPWTSYYPSIGRKLYRGGSSDGE